MSSSLPELATCLNTALRRIASAGPAIRYTDVSSPVAFRQTHEQRDFEIPQKDDSVGLRRLRAGARDSRLRILVVDSVTFRRKQHFRLQGERTAEMQDEESAEIHRRLDSRGGDRVVERFDARQGCERRSESDAVFDRASSDSDIGCCIRCRSLSRNRFSDQQDQQRGTDRQP